MNPKEFIDEHRSLGVVSSAGMNHCNNGKQTAAVWPSTRESASSTSG